MHFKLPAWAAASVGISTAATSCRDFTSSLTIDNVDASIISCTDYSAGTTFDIEGGQSVCTSSATPEVDIRRLVLSVATSSNSQTYIEVWLPSGDNVWNGRLLATDNGGLGGCVAYDDMTYTSSMGFAVVGDNAAHNNTSFDGSGFLNNNDIVVDFSHRSRHAAIVSAKQVVDQYYNQAPSYSYYLGCSTGGRQGLKSAQIWPDDFDGIIAGSSASDFNHLSDWTGRFRLITGFGTDDRAISVKQWAYVHDEVLDQCDEPLDGVNDGIIEDPTICEFNATVLKCDTSSDSRCLTSTQVTTVNDVYSELYDQSGKLIWPSLSLGAELEASTQGLLTGSVQGTSAGWFQYAVYNDSTWNPDTISQTDYTKADQEDVLHGNISSFDGDLSAFREAGSKLIMYHGLADPNIAGEQSQRYYLHVAATMGLGNDDLDKFLRFYRISGGSHCSSGGSGAWMFGQSGPARNASDNIIWDLVNWVEQGQAPDTLTGTKFNNDDPAQGVAFERPHCRFPYRTTYDGSGDPNVTTSWGCTYIDDWQDCGAGALPRLC